MTTANSPHELIPHLFRTEYSRLTAALCRLFGIRHIEMAEDIASDVFLKATESWSVHGIPENPVAWLYAAAKNKARDQLRHLAVREKHHASIARDVEHAFFTSDTVELQAAFMRDSQLSMLFAVCHASNSPDAQISLALQILCGFSVEEIASAFLTQRETIKKRLFRARNNLRQSGFMIGPMSPKHIAQSLPVVQKTLYLLFNEGYFSRNENLIIRKDLCSEAIRLTLLLTENPVTDTPATNALLALMCFQSSRLEARTDEQGIPVLFDQQDRTRWDQTLIARGNHYLVRAVSRDALSVYHLEAAIAYWHASGQESEKWPHILQLYDKLLELNPTPINRLNRLFALSKVAGKTVARKEAAHLPDDTLSYQLLMGYLLVDSDPEAARTHYEQALSKTVSQSVKTSLQKLIAETIQ